MQPFAGMLRGLDPTKTPLLWTRLCTLAALCDALVSGDRIAVALDAKPFALEPLIDRCRDGFIVANRDRVIAEIRAVAAKLVVANGPGASPGP
jgi:hypothetical protein